MKLVGIIICALLICEPVLAKKKKRRSSGPPLTHPVVLWSRILSENKDFDERKKAAFKLSKYSQPIFQIEVINTLLKCADETNIDIKVLCTIALSNANKAIYQETIQKKLIDIYQKNPELKNTIVKVFINRKDNSPKVHDFLLDNFKEDATSDELLTQLRYFELFGNGSDKLVDVLSNIYNKKDNLKVKTSIVKVLGERGKGQAQVIELLSQCCDSKDTPLQLTCLSSLQSQAKKDPKVWLVVTKTIQSADSDVLLATLELIHSLPPTPNPKIALRLDDIIKSVDDSDVQEKAILALGICGDKNPDMVQHLIKILKDKSAPEASRVASALVVGNQSPADLKENAKSALVKCKDEEKSSSLRTACQLGIQELGT
jgi:hypothetical protein